MRVTLSDWTEGSNPEKKFSDGLEGLMGPKGDGSRDCPKVNFVYPGSCGVSITNFRDAMEKWFRVPFWQKKMTFDGEHKKHPLFRISADGVQAGEMFVHDMEIVGVTCLNMDVELLQNVSAYMPLAVVPMQESKGGFERFLNQLYASLDATTEVAVPTEAGELVRKPFFVDSDDYACECYKLHHMGSNCTWLCTECTVHKDHWRGGESSVQGNETKHIDDHKDGCVFHTARERRLTSVLKEEVVEHVREVEELEKSSTRRHAATQSTLKHKKEQLDRKRRFLERTLELDRGNEGAKKIIVYEAERRYNVEYPVLKRGFEVEGCKHQWESHTCGCYLHLGDAFMDFFGHSHDELLEKNVVEQYAIVTPSSDLALIEEELKYSRANATTVTLDNGDKVMRWMDVCE